MAQSVIFSGYYKGHSAIFGNTLVVGSGTASGNIYTTTAGGTTSNYLLNGSSAVFSLPAGSTVIFSELILASSDFLNSPSDNIVLKTPISTNTIPYGTLITGYGGWKMRYQDVTSLVDLGGSGVYEVSQVRSNLNASSWCIYAVYTNIALRYRYFNYTRGVTPVLNSTPTVNVVFNEMITPPVGGEGYILMSSTRGDFTTVSEIRVNGSVIGNPSVGIWDGNPPYNRDTNIQSGVICIADTNDSDIGLLDTRGTFGGANNQPYAQIYPIPNRAWTDISGFDISNELQSLVSSIDVQLMATTTLPSGYIFNILALEAMAIVPPIKYVDKTYADLGDTLTYSIVVINDTVTAYSNLIFIDTIPSGTSYISNSFKKDGVTIGGSLQGGINLGVLDSMKSTTLTFEVLVDNTMPSSDLISNQGRINFVTAGITIAQGSNFTSTTIVSGKIQPIKTAKLNSYINDTITYTLTLNNVGNISSNNVTIIDTIPSEVSFINGSFKINGVSTALTLPIANIGTLPVGVTTVTFDVLVNTLPSLNPIGNSATVSYSYIVQETVPSNKSSISNTAYTNINYASMVVEKIAEKGYVTCMDYLKYFVILRNMGNVTANNIVFIDTIPSGTTFINNSFTYNSLVVFGANPTLGVNLGSIPPFSVSTVTFEVGISC